MTKLSIDSLLRRCYHAEMAFMAPHIAKEGLNPGQPKILRILNEQGPCPQKEIAARCGIEPATVTRLLDAMEAKCLIVRTVSRQDRRVTEVSLTETGREANKRVRCHFSALEARMLDGFTEEEKEAFADMLARSYTNLTGKEL